MKIKPPNKKKVTKHAYSNLGWLPEEKVKKRGRLKQLSKANRKSRTTAKKSEFIALALKLEQKGQNAG